MPKHIIIRVLQTSNKEKNLKSREKRHTVQKIKEKDHSRFPVCNNCKQEDTWSSIFTERKKKTIKVKLYIQRKSFKIQGKI